ncbi:MAG: endonuclease/exonuclease/phosphatase family protein [Pseudomonadota bacterium]
MDHVPDKLRVATWNVHRGVGGDGRFDPARILRAIADEIAPHGPDVLVLQEADADAPSHRGFLDLAELDAATGLRHAHTPDLLWRAESHGFLGVVVFLHPRLNVIGRRVMDLPGHAARGAVVLDLDMGLRLVATHLSLAQWLRAVQMRTLGQYLDRSPDRPTLLVGDLNEWRPWGGLAFSRPVAGRAFTGPARPTFPVGWPILPLDRVLGDRPGMVTETRVLDGPGLRTASDHRPLLAQVHLDSA